MRTPLHPFGILLAHTLPAVILITLFGDTLRIVHPLLEPESIDLWWRYGTTFGAVTVACAAYALLSWRWQRPVHPFYAVFIFLTHVPLLWGFMEQFSDMLPWSIPRWMVAGDAELYAIRFLSVPLAHALFVLVVSSLRANDRGNPLRDLLIAAGIPLGCYLFVQVVEPYRLGFDFERHLWTVVLVTLVIGFLFFLFRGVLALVQRTGSGWKVAGMVAMVLIALVFPLAGLALNNGVIGYWREVEGAFGDLSHPALYIIAVLNAVVVLWPSSTAPRVRLLQFVLRGIGFSYVLYFFLLFLPLLPVSIVAVLVIGIGFLLLAPVLLFIVQARLLYADACFVATHRSRIATAVILVASIAALPAAISIRNLRHRSILRAALDHVYADPGDDPHGSLDADALAYVLDQVDTNKPRGRGGWGQRGTPFLTPWYNRVVLDNLTVSDEKMAVLRAVFLNEPIADTEQRTWRAPSVDVLLDSIAVRSTYDNEQQAWRSWVHLGMKNHGEQQSEFVTDITLPEGAWISDNYLIIEGDTVKGLLAEKKAAMWVYNNIVNYRRDPSILRYKGHNKLQLRVFPFAAGGTRWSGFEVLHKEAFPMTVAEDTILLGDTLHAAPEQAIMSDLSAVAYIPRGLKQRLPLVRRQPHYHFVVDGTEAQRPTREATMEVVRRYIAQEHLDAARITLHIADAYTTAVPWDTNPTEQYLHHVGNGGFFSDRTIRRILIAACISPGPETPVIVLVPSMPSYSTESWGIMLPDLKEIATCLPEGDPFLVLDESLMPSRHPFHDPHEQLNHEPITLVVPEVHAWPNATEPKAYLPVGPDGGIIADVWHMDNIAPLRERWWLHALTLEGYWRKHLVSPTDQEWRELVRGSFQAQVLSPTTAWMCLEDDAQRNALLKKQEEVLSASNTLDVSEPDILWLILPVVLWFILRKRWI